MIISINNFDKAFTENSNSIKFKRTKKDALKYINVALSQ